MANTLANPVSLLSKHRLSVGATTTYNPNSLTHHWSLPGSRLEQKEHGMIHPRHRFGIVVIFAIILVMVSVDNGIVLVVDGLGVLRMVSSVLRMSD